MKVVEKKEDFDADPALVSDQAAARLDPAGFDPGEGEFICPCGCLVTPGDLPCAPDHGRCPLEEYQ